MADTTSVGVIQLDVEINPQSLNAEINKLGKAFNNSFKNMFSGMVGQTNNFVRDSINKIGSGFKNFAQAGTGSSEKVSKSISKMNTKYEKTQEEIRKIQEELAALDVQRDTIFEKYKDFPAFSGMTKDESLEQILNSDKEFQRLSVEIDKLTAKIGPLKEKNRQLADEIKNAGEQANNTDNNFKNMGNSAKKAGRSIFNLSWMKRIFSNESKKATNAASNFGNTMNRVSRMIARNLIVYGLIIKGLKGMISYMWSALKTNQQFAQSLNIIKTNLLVAFQPIYSFVLPALNALMQAVATVTTYISSAISALFGKTYKQSFGAAKNMNNQIKAMEGLGKAAGGAGKKAKKAGKEAEGMLMPFDEINQLDLDKGKDDAGGGGGGGAGGFEMEMPDLATIDIGGIERFKEIMGQIFEPFKKAWENEGQSTIDAMKYALEGIKGLIKAIGKSWLEVWTNGTGQTILETMLRILQNIFNTVGDIAQSFTKAWIEGGRGTAIMQHIHNIIQHILTLTERLTGAFRTVWGEVGDQLARVFLETLKNILGVFDHLGEKLVWVWDYGGKYLFEGFAKLLAKLIELAGYTINSFIVPFAHGFINIAAPAVAVVMKAIGYLLEVFADLIGWMLGKGKPVLDLIITVLGSMAIAFGIVKAAIKTKMVVLAAYQTVMSAAFVMGETFKAGLAAIATPAGIAVVAITAIITIGTLLYKHWDEISVGLKKIWEGIKNTAETIWNGIADFFAKLWEGITTALTEAWNAIVEFLVGLWNGLSESVTEIWTAISEFISDAWNAISEKTSEIWNAIKNFLIEKIWNPIKSAAQTIWNGIKKVILDPIIQAKASLEEKWKAIKEYILKKWNEIRQGIADMKDKLINAIMKPFEIAEKKIQDVISSAYNWGRNLIQNFIDGIKAMIGKVRDAVKSVADTVSDFLGFSSPTKEGPGSDADKWMPNLMGMLAAGIEDNIAQVSSAINMTAGSIQQGVQPNTDDMAASIGSAVSQSIQGISNDGGDITIIVKVGEDTLTDKVVSNINRQNRINGETVIQV